jgi:hypothetical protein
MPHDKVVRDSAVMLGGLGFLAYVASMLTREAIGHGGACIAFGGRNLMLTGWRERCSLGGVEILAISAAGPGVQFAA